MKYLKTINGWKIEQTKHGDLRITNIKDRDLFTWCNYSNGQFDSEYLIPDIIKIWCRKWLNVK